jgi:hypothetical protein
MNNQEPINHTILDEDLDGLLEHFADASGDLPGVMETCYKDLMLIGCTIKQASVFDRDAFDVNMRLCIRYNMNVENYLRVKELHDLSLEVQKDSRIEVDKSIVNDITINSN